MKAIAAIAVLAFAGSAAAQNSPDDLIQAIRTDNLALLKSRLTKGADVNARDSRGDTLLMLAAAYGTPEAVKLLLDAGADVKAKNQFDATALIFGANHPQKARMLVEKGADVNARSKQGRTPLMIAATCDGCVDTVRLLIGKGADVKAKDFRDTTALYSASEANDIDTIQLLLEKGADPDSGGVGGYTALMSAASFCNLPAIRLLLSKGADVNAASTFGGRVKFGPIQLIHITPLMAAAPYCQADVLRALLDAGAKINEKDSRNMTALMLALGSEHQDPEVVSLLLSSRADPNVISTMGETALDWAQKFGNRQIIAVLRAGGARTGDAFTPPERKSSGARSVRQAVESAVALLQRSSTEFFKQSGCVGCHHQPFTTMAVAAAHANGVGFDETAAKEQIGMIKALEIQRQEPLLERIETGGFTDPPVYSLLAAGAAQFPASLDTDTVSLYVAGAQHRDGTWRLPEFPRAPSAEGVIARTAFTARVLQLYGSPAKKAEFASRIARARDWLLQATPATNDDFAMQMLGLHWTGAASDKVKAIGRALIAMQREDGGWAPNPNLASDAFATGQTLWALHEAGILPASDPVYERGVKYLLNTQWQDGSWYVRSRAVKFQPYFQSGFPYDHDQWISAMATGYAVMALAPAVEHSQQASR